MEELSDFPPNSLPGSRIGTSKSTQSYKPPGEVPVRVVVRIRPPIKRELDYYEDETIQCLEDQRSIQILENKTHRVVTYDRVYDQQTLQEDVFLNSGITDLIERAIEGFSVTIFAFGQTGSGKTYTMTGPDVLTLDSQGLIPRSLVQIYQLLSKPSSSTSIVQFKVQATFLEIYNEQVYDLLSTSNAILPLKWRQHQGFYAEHAIHADCNMLEQSLAIFKEGLKNRTVKCHALNDRSSRSHSILTLYITTQVHDNNGNSLTQKYGKISFVDLAGSERVKQSKSQGEALTEALNINKSLLVLGNCIAMLADSKRESGHIPYRDSKLTKLLMDSLGGKGLALMIACISRSKFALSETLQTLRYASRAKKIKNKPTLREDFDFSNVSQLKKELLSLRKENQQLKQHFSRSFSQAFSPPSSSSSSSFSSSSFMSGTVNEEKENLSKMLQSYAMELDSLKYENMQLAESKQRTEHMYANLMRETESIRGQTQKLDPAPPFLPALPTSSIVSTSSSSSSSSSSASSRKLKEPTPTLASTNSNFMNKKKTLTSQQKKNNKAVSKQVLPPSSSSSLILPSITPTTSTAFSHYHSTLVPDLSTLKEDMHRLDTEIAKYTRL